MNSRPFRVQRKLDVVRGAELRTGAEGFMTAAPDGFVVPIQHHDTRYPSRAP